MKNFFGMITIILYLNAFAQDYTLANKTTGLKASEIHKHIRVNGLKNVQEISIKHTTLTPKELKTLKGHIAKNGKRLKDLYKDNLLVRDMDRSDQILAENLGDEAEFLRDKLERGSRTKKIKFNSSNIHEFDSKLAALLKNENKIVKITFRKQLAANASKVIKKALPYTAVIALMLTAERTLAGTKESAKLNKSKSIFNGSGPKVVEKGSSKKSGASAKSNKTSAL